MFLFLSVMDFRATKYLTSLEEKPGHRKNNAKERRQRSQVQRFTLFSIFPKYQHDKSQGKGGDEVWRGFGVLQHR